MPARSGLLLVFGLIFLIALALYLQPEAAWEGVDIAVVGRFADDLGRPASQPLLNLQGDLLLFVFTAGGAVAGFIVGYNWRALFGSGEGRQQEKGQLEEHSV